MRFVDFKPLDIGAAPVEFVREIAEPGTPPLWLELAEQAFTVLHAMPDLKDLKRRDLAACALAVVHQFVLEMGGENFYIAKGERLHPSEIL